MTQLLDHSVFSLSHEEAQPLVDAHPSELLPGSDVVVVGVPPVVGPGLSSSEDRDRRTIRLKAALEAVITAAATSIHDDADAYRRFVDAITSTRPAGRGLLVQAHRFVAAEQALEDEFGLLTSAEVAQLSGSTATNTAATAARWVSARKIVAVPRGEGANRFPGFQFGPGGQPKPVVAEVIAAFAGKLDAAALALWFVAANGWLNGDRPVDIMDGARREVVDAASELAAELA